MYKLYLWLALLLMIEPAKASEQEQSIVFTATPDQCVALHKGQTCYQDVVFQWQTPEVGRFCLVFSESQQQLVCWDGRTIQQFQYSFESDSSAAFSLIHSDSNNIRAIAEVKVVVTWVYKAPKQSPSGWRLF